MKRLVLPAALFLAGCSSLHLPGVRSDFYETQYRGVQALDGDVAAFARLQDLQGDWASRGKRGFVSKITPWNQGNRDRAAQLADATVRVIDARDEVLAQRDLVEVMGNALKDLEAEYDSIAALLAEGEDVPVASISLAAEQKYLARRMANSLVLMSQSDMTGAVEAADLFGRDVSRFQQLLDAAINGDEEMGIDPPDNPEVEESLAQIEDLFTGYVADSSNDVLENVVARYDAWLALREMTALGNEVLLGSKDVVTPAPAEDAGGGAEPVDADADAGTEADADAMDSSPPTADETDVDEAADEGAVESDESGSDEEFDEGMDEDIEADVDAAVDEEVADEPAAVKGKR